MIDQLIRSKRRTLSLQVTSGAEVIVRAPEKLSEKRILHFIEQKRDWILQKQEEARAAFQPPKQFLEGEEFLYLGRRLKLRIADLERAPVVLAGEELVVSRDYHSEAAVFVERWYRREARRILTERVHHFSRLTGHVFSEIKITGARTRWGSCSPSGTLSFSWRLIMAPLAAVDYVAVHELVHLEEKNHSQNFWKKIERIVPDYPAHLEWLRRNEPAMNL